MEELLSKINTLEFEEYGWLNLVNVQRENGDLYLIFNLNNGEDDNKISSWLVKASSVIEYKLCDFFNLGLNYFQKDHVVLEQYTDKMGNLFFRGSYDKPETVVGALYEAHVACAQDWIVFDKYLNTEITLSNLIRDGFGKIASGSLFLLKTYYAVLTKFSIRSKITDEKMPKRWDGSSWRHNSPKPKMIHFGNSYIVAEHFEVTRQNEI